MDWKEYRESVIEEVKVSASADLNYDRAEFINYVTEKLIDAEELSEYNPCYFEGSGKKNRKLQIDGYSFDDLDNCLNIICCVYDGGAVPANLTQSKVTEVFDRAKAFIEDAESGLINSTAEESSPGFGLAIDIKNRGKLFEKFKLYVVSDMPMKLLEIKDSQLFGKPLEYNVWDITRFFKIAESKTGKEDIVINVKDFAPSGIPCLCAGMTAEYTAYLCNVSGKLLAELYKKFGSRLLEGNVRSFLSIKGKVNKGIRSTIINKPEMFFAYNNGIATTAYDVKVEENGGEHFITEITSLQIVNGGQTTASLEMAMRNDKNADLSKIYVPMKLSIVSPEKAESLIPEISRFANSQNKVSDADFFSNSPFHVRIEEFSRRISAPAISGNQFGTRWFYERARGQYSQEQAKLTPAEKTKFLLLNPKSQMIVKTDYAKYINTYLQKPHQVSMGAQKNFLHFANFITSKWDKNDTEFNESFFKQSICLAIIFKAVDKFVKNQDYYENGYKLNIVTYTIAKFFQTLQVKHPNMSFNFKTIWQKQSISVALKQELLKISALIMAHITNPNRPIQNVTEWCKREACWTQAEALDFDFSPEILLELVDKNVVTEEQIDAKKEQKMSNKINCMVDVANKGSGFWRELLRWGIDAKVFSQVEVEILRTATNMEKGMFPSEKQCIRILEILDKARVESFSK